MAPVRGRCGCGTPRGGLASAVNAGVALSLDVTALFSGEVVQDEDLIYASNSGTALSALLPPIPRQAEVAALHLNGTQILFAVDTACVIEGSAVGIPDGVRIDSLALTANSNLLLSFDQPAQVGSLFVADEDLVRIFPSPLIVFDGSAEGIDPSLDLNGASTAPNGLGLLSFDGSGAIDGIDFDDEDVLGREPTAGNFLPSLDASLAPRFSWMLI